MKLLLSCPKCEKPLQVDATLSGSQTDCPDCGQRFIVGPAGSQLPVVQPQAIVAPPAVGAQTSPERTAALPKGHGEAPGPGRGMEAGTKGKIAGGTPPAGARLQRRKCAKCGSQMSVSHGENHFLDFLLPLGSTVYWGCERCGNEVKVQSPRRILLMLLVSPLIVVWWFVFTESSRQHDENAAWWVKALEDYAPHDSRGSFWYILFLLLFALAPLALIREVIIRLRYPRIP